MIARNRFFQCIALLPSKVVPLDLEHPEHLGEAKYIPRLILYDLHRKTLTVECRGFLNRRNANVSKDGISRIPDILRRCERELLVNWMERQLSADTLHRDLIKDAELQEQSREFLTIFREAMQNGNLAEIGTSEWAAAREFLSNLSRSRAQQGFSPTETATFIFSLKQPLYDFLCQEYGRDTDGLVNDLWTATTMLDKLGLYTTEVFQKTREGVIGRQQQELLELSTPVVELWGNILALPLIGTLDSARTQVVMESLLQKIVESGSSIAIIDITGVPTVDTLVAQHLLKTVAAARLMGADCIISGIRPQIAQTIVHLGVDLTDVVTKATLADAFALALQRSGLTVKRVANGVAQVFDQPRISSKAVSDKSKFV
jgi:rsbT co-antagonist protein RsbR